MNAGRVELDLVAVGKDQVSAMLRAVDAQAKKTAESIKGSGQAASGLGDQLDGLKGKASGVNKVREVFENLSSNAGFLVGTLTAVGGAVVGVVTEIVDLVSGADDARRAIEQWAKYQADFNKALENGWKALDKFSQSPIEAALSDVNIQLARAEGLLKSIRGDEEEWRKKSDEVRGLKALQAALVSDIARDAERAAEAWAKILRNMREAEDIDLGSVQGPNPFVANSDDADLKLSRNPVTGEAETEDMRAARLKRQKEAADRARARMRGGRGRELAEQRGDFFGQTPQVSDRWAVDPEVASNAKRVIWEEPPADFWAQDGLDKLTKMTVQADEFANALNKIADATGSLDAKLPGLSSAFSEIAAIWEKTTGSAESLAGGVLGSVNAIANAGAAWIKDEKARTRFLGMKELLLAGPMAFIDPVRAAVMASTGLGLLALAGGGGGGGGGARGGGARGASNSEGGSSSGGSAGVIVNNVHNYQMGFGDRQTMIAAQRQGERSARGTGIGAGAGV